MRKILTASLILFLSTNAFAGDTGKIAGRVLDAATKQPLIGASVQIMGTSLGASTDLDGRYNILNIQPGVYAVRASTIGYQPVEVKNNRVSIDLTTEVNFELGEAAITTEAVVVMAQRPLVQKDMTASTAVIDNTQIQSLPVTSFQDVLNLQAGIYTDRNGTLHARGGRGGEVTYMIDGVPVTDSYDGSTVVGVNKNSIQEMQVVTGAFNAEYGQAMSGIVNIATKTGGNDMHAAITAQSGGYVTSHSDVFTGLQTVNPLNTNWLEGSVDGPIVKDKLFFYLDARYYYDGGDLYGVRKYNTSDVANTTDPNKNNWIIQQTGDGALVPLAPYLEAYGQGKLTYKVSPEFQVSYNYILDNSRGKNFDWNYKYDPDGELSNFTKGNLNTLNITHSLSASTFYTFGVSYYFKDYREYLDENPFSLSDLFTRQDPFNQAFTISSFPSNIAPEGTFYTGGMNTSNNIHYTDTYVAKFDITSQVTDVHMLKAGVEFDQYRLYLHDVTPQLSSIDLGRNPLSGDPYLEGPLVIPPISSSNNLLYTHSPRQFAAYVQDKMEYKSLIVNLGLRFDWFSPDGQILSNPEDPNVYLPLEEQYQDSVIAPLGNGVTPANQASISLQRREALWYKNATNKWQVSPRLGVSFPITDRGIIHFSYGLFFQIPSFDELYENPGYKLGVTSGQEYLGVIGNPDLKPEETTNGELGLQQQLTDDISIDITGFFRDIRNLAGTLNELIPVYGGSYYSEYVNSDFGFIKGIVFTFDKHFSNGISATVDYTFQIAKGDESDPQQAFNLIKSNTLPETQLIPLNWDQRHTLDATFDYTGSGGWGGSLVFRFGSGTPYTPNSSLLQDVGELAQNSQYMPATYDLDARLFKNFKIGTTTFTIFARIDNVLDIKNATNVYDDSGQPDWSLAEEHALASNPLEKVASLQDYYTNPSFYSAPRRIQLGVTYAF